MGIAAACYPPRTPSSAHWFSLRSAFNASQRSDQTRVTYQKSLQLDGNYLRKTLAAQWLAPRAMDIDLVGIHLVIRKLSTKVYLRYKRERF